MDTDKYTCPICGKPSPCFVWTIYHGVGQCNTCGSPTRLTHYEDDKLVEKPPELTIEPEYIPIIQAYWNETHRKIPSGFEGFGELSGSVTTMEERNEFHAWMNANAERMLADAQSPDKRLFVQT